MHAFKYLPINKISDFTVGFHLIMIQDSCSLQTFNMDVQDLLVNVVEINNVNDVFLAK